MMTQVDPDVRAYEVCELVPGQRIPRGVLLGTALKTEEVVTVKRSTPADFDQHGITLHGIGTLFMHRHTLVRAYPPE